MYLEIEDRQDKSENAAKLATLDVQVRQVFRACEVFPAALGLQVAMERKDHVDHLVLMVKQENKDRLEFKDFLGSLANLEIKASLATPVRMESLVPLVRLDQEVILEKTESAVLPALQVHPETVVNEGLQDKSVQEDFRDFLAHQVIQGCQEKMGSLALVDLLVLLDQVDHEENVASLEKEEWLDLLVPVDCVEKLDPLETMDHQVPLARRA